ncbi:hypothetical protein JM16_006384 [Phytophthora kernoviae]|uniref:Probable pectate lyase F n=1 Tax=Phytophthora kernoviae TaxID=325452 RepID=A0A8T0LVC8_9STRA|nr:hypothetical protein JM16_006384 [Phytophthora kernoviae]
MVLLPLGGHELSGNDAPFVDYPDKKSCETFDGELKTYQRSDITCEGQTESGSSTAVFLVEAGGTLKNVIIGADQMEGVHCDDSDCTIENVCIVTVNENNGDEATLSNIYIKADDDGYTVCAWSQATDGDEPTELGDGIKDPLCQYSESDINVNGDVSTATSTTSNSTSTSTSTTATSGSSATSSVTTSSASTTQEALDEETTSSPATNSDSDDENTQESTSAPSTPSSESNGDNDDDEKKDSEDNDDEKTTMTTTRTLTTTKRSRMMR